MAKMVKKLTAKNGVMYGIEVAHQYDFEDDGNYFRGFVYTNKEGFKLPLTQCYSRNDKTVYLCVRVDYLEGNAFTYKEWMETEEWRLADKFNGYGEFDLEELVSNMEKIIAKINELNGKAIEEKIDTKPVVDQLKKEIDEAGLVLLAAKGIDIFNPNLRDYDVKEIRECYNFIRRDVNHMYETIEKIESGLIERKTLKEMIERFKNFGYVEFQRTGYFAEGIMKHARKLY